MQLPVARTADLIEQDLDNELLIYDLRINKAYTLNETLMKVHRGCDGRQTFDDLKRKYKFTDDLIHLALQELAGSNLLENYAAANHFAGMSRREVVRKIGLATMVALPLIASITAPKSIHAASNQQAVNFCEEVECPYAEDQCHYDGRCDETTGDCFFPVKEDGTPCNDNDFSTVGDVCTNGVCAGICDTGLTECTPVIGTRCKNLQTDPNNCGGCGITCSSGQTCVNGSCTMLPPP